MGVAKEIKYITQPKFQIIIKNWDSENFGYWLLPFSWVPRSISRTSPGLETEAAVGHRKRTRAGELPADPPGASGCAEPGLARHLFETKSGSGCFF